MFESIGILILLVLGLALCFFGKRILETIAFVIGAIAGAALALVLAPRLYQFVEEYLTLNQCLIIAVIVGALIGGYLGKRLMYGMISLLVASTCSYAANVLTGDAMITLITFFVVLVIMWFLVEKFLAVITAFLGASMVGTSAMYGILFLFDMPFIGFVVFLIVTAALTYFGARYQLD
jgi:hypothetical protein